MLTGAVQTIFGDRIQAMLSGHEVFPLCHAKPFPASSTGFGLETGHTVHAHEMAVPAGLLPDLYGRRPVDPVSKLSTYRAFGRSPLLMVQLFKYERPIRFFSALTATLADVSLLLGFFLLQEYLATGPVPRFPTSILATGIMLFNSLSFFRRPHSRYSDAWAPEVAAAIAPANESSDGFQDG
jgi:hypothetical protein